MLHPPRRDAFPSTEPWCRTSTDRLSTAVATQQQNQWTSVTQEDQLKIRAMLLAVATIFAAANLSAAAVNWTLVGVDFDTDFNYGGPLTGLTGSFVYDADTNIFSSVRITGKNGLLTGVVFAGQSNLQAVAAGGPDLTDLGFAAIVLADAMTNDGGTVGIQAVYSGTCANAACDRFDTADAVTSRGSVVGTAGTPEPSSVLLAASGLFGLLGLATRRRSPV